MPKSLMQILSTQIYQRFINIVKLRFYEIKLALDFENITLKTYQRQIYQDISNYAKT